MVRRDGRAAPRSHPLRSLLKAATALTAAVTLAGCSLLGGSNTDEAQGNDKVEKERITIGVQPVVDLAPVHLAVKKGYFAEEGLQVELVDTPGGPQAVTDLIGGALDFAFASHVPFFINQSQGTARLKIVVDGYAAKDNVMVLMAPPNSPVKGPQDVPGRRVAVVSEGSISDTSVKAVLKDHGLDYNNVKWQILSFPAMMTGFNDGTFDAALLVEPFITQAQKQFGAVKVFDAASGPNAELSLAGYATTEDFAKKYPKTVAAFQRAVLKAQAEAADRKVVEELVAEYTNIDKETISLMNLGSFPTSVEAVRLQRVADLLLEFQLISGPVNAEEMVFRPESQESQQ